MRRVSLSDPDLVYDPTDPEGFRVGMDRFGPRLGAEQTGASLYHLPPGEALCPYHYEYGEEEWLLVLDGRPTVRTPEGSEQLGPLELVFFPTGPDGAHKIVNDSDDPVRALMWSNHLKVTATAYPDSDKIGIWTGDKAEDVMVRRSSNVEYYDGEAGEHG